MKVISRIKASNILSFGPDGLDLPLESLNILIGPNGSGKSNFIELLSMLRAIPRSAEDSSSNLERVISRGGGIKEWIWKGSSPGNDSSIEIIMPRVNQASIRHRFEFYEENSRLRIADEVIENELATRGHSEPYFYYRYQHGQPVISTGKDRRSLVPDSVNVNFSILAQRRDPESYPELSEIASSYERFRLYREWSFGRSSVFRESQKADLRNDRLEEDFSNLGLFLSRLGRTPAAKRELTAALKKLYEGLEGFEVIIEAGTVQVSFSESNFSIPATRLSDGTLRYLCLLAILLDPAPPPLICIEEPELGMHPDMLPQIADLLIQASERTQLFVTTHSDILIDAMTERPECVITCEKHDGQTIVKRLKREDLSEWLEKYRLGQLWTMGEIGANRW